MSIQIQQLAIADARYKWVAAWGIQLKKTSAGDFPWVAGGPFMIALTMKTKRLHIVKAELGSVIYSKAFAHVLKIAMIEQERAAQLGCKCPPPHSVILDFNAG